MAQRLMACSLTRWLPDLCASPEMCLRWGRRWRGVAPVLPPQAQVGDLLVLHDTGAYGASMSSNYNARPLIAEVLMENGEPRLIRRRQTVAELLALEAV